MNQNTIKETIALITANMETIALQIANVENNLFNNFSKNTLKL